VTSYTLPDVVYMDTQRTRAVGLKDNLYIPLSCWTRHDTTRKALETERHLRVKH